MCTAPVPARPARDLPRLELTEIVRAHGAAYRRTHALAWAQRRALHAIATCRTATLGGHREVCESCGGMRITYNSCRNRHCPKCQTLAKERWLEARRAERLPAEYFHVVFTLPHALNALAQGDPRVIYTLLFRAARDTLLAFGRDPRHLGGEIGVTAILHTWGQTLSPHLHLHCLVTGGALARDGARWIPARPGFSFPVRALSQVFRAKYLAALRQAFTAGRLSFAGSTTPPADPPAFAAWLRQRRARDWVVHAKPPSAGPPQVLAYLGRYTHRVALSNHRLVGFGEGIVRFRWKDYTHGHTVKVMALDAGEFLRRFLLHVVPGRFIRIRHFGPLANRHRAARLTRCRALLGQPPLPPETPPESVAQRMLRLAGVDLARCPFCQRGRLRVVNILAPTLRRSHPPQAWDTS